jgi:uncharacterized protein (TIGR02453 family)
MPAVKPAPAVQPFSGFPPAAVQFFRDVARHNTKEWYDAHADAYKRDVITPAQAFVTEMGPKLRKLSGGVSFDLDANGKGSIKKIQTDRRFNPDRDPYKTYVEILFWEGPLKVKKENSGFYFRFDPDGMVFSAGLKYFEKPTLAAFRRAVLDPARGAGLDKLVKAALKAGYNLGGAGGFKQLPRGTDPDYQYAPYLLHEALYAWKRVPLAPELHSAALLETALAHYKALAPVHKWCVDLLSA